MTNVFELLERTAAEHGGREAIIENGVPTTFAELLQDALRESKQFSGLAGVRTGFVSGNGRQFLVGLFALLRAGAIVCPIAPGRPEAEREQTSKNLELGAIIDSSSSGFVLTRYVPPANEESSICASPALIRPTSGTTATARGVVLSHATVLERTAAAIEALAISKNDRICWVLQMAQHFVVSILAYVRAGAAIVLSEDLLGESVVETIQSEGCTILYASPLHYGLLANSRKRGNLSSLRLALSTTAVLRPDIALQFETRQGVAVRQVLGIIELGLPIGDVSNERTAGSLGRPFPGFEARVLGEHGPVSGAGAEGELLLRGPGMFDGYFKPAAPREEFLLEGFFPTGDLVRICSDGSFELIGRKKAVIISAGQKIFPEEVEAVLDRYPGIRASRVYSESHETFGEVVVAEVETEYEAELSGEEAIRFCRKELSGFKVPQRIYIREKLPRTATGKLVRGQSVAG